MSDFDPSGQVFLLAETIDKLRWKQTWMRKADRQGGWPKLCPSVCMQGKCLDRDGFITAFCRAEQMHAPTFSYQMERGKCGRQHYPEYCRRLFSAFFIYPVQIHFILSILQVPPWMHGCSNYPSTTLTFIPHLQYSHLSLHCGWSRLCSWLSTDLPWHWKNLILLEHEVFLIPAT